jgi:hypothetical protein
MSFLYFLQFALVTFFFFFCKSAHTSSPTFYGFFSEVFDRIRDPDGEMGSLCGRRNPCRSGLECVLAGPRRVCAPISCYRQKRWKRNSNRMPISATRQIGFGQHRDLPPFARRNLESNHVATTGRCALGGRGSFLLEPGGSTNPSNDNEQLSNDVSVMEGQILQCLGRTNRTNEEQDNPSVEWVGIFGWSSISICLWTGAFGARRYIHFASLFGAS